MKFAKYWEKIETPVDKGVFGLANVIIWGASNDSADKAMESARERAGIFSKIAAKGFPNRHEYEYWNGFIREEVLEEITGENGNILAVITRNSYGATVLNSEQVLFGDIDVSPPGLMSRLMNKFGRPIKDKQFYVEQIRSYQARNHEISVRIYETFAGLRFVFTNKLFEAGSPAVDQVFSELNVDPLYTSLCKRQECFRARLSPKPWRIGLERPTSRFPRVLNTELENFNAWIDEYRSAASTKSVVKLLDTLGTESIHPDVKLVLAAHDTLANSGRAELA